MGARRVRRHCCVQAHRSDTKRQTSAHKDPFPPIPSMYPGASFITANHFALAHLFANGFGFALRCLPRTLHNRNRITLAQRDPEDVLTYLGNPFVSQVIFVVQTRHHCFQACGEFPALQFSTTQTTHFILLGFYDYWLDFR